jgi:MFS family permease
MVTVKDGNGRASFLQRLLPEQPVLRSLTVVTLINTFGNGLFLTTSVLFFTRAADLTPAQVGLGLAAAGVCGIVAGVPVGRLSDRWGARRTLISLLLAEAIGVLAYTRIQSFALFLVLVCVVTFIDQGATTVRNALIGIALPPESRVRGRAYLRVMTNVGIGLGSAVAAVALHYDTLQAYESMVYINSVTFLAAAAILLRLPGGHLLVASPTTIPLPSRRRLALADRPYLLITTLAGLLSIQVGILEVGVPLWVADHTNAPRWIISAVMVLNTAMVIILQLRLSRRAGDPARAATACLRAGSFFAAACVLFGLAHGLSPLLAVAVILGGGALHTLGEILSSAGGWALSYELADPSAPGDYQGVFNSGIAAGMLLSPLLVTSTAINFGMVGWLFLAALFLLTGAAFIPATRFAIRRHI